jgi:hypothetical protein
MPPAHTEGLNHLDNLKMGPGKLKARAAKLIACTLFIFAAGLMGITLSKAAGDSAPVLSPKQWHEDLQFYASELPKRHTNPFHFTTRENFDAAISALDQTLDHTDFDHFFVGLRQIAGTIGDGHTNIGLPNDMEAIQFPIVFARFEDDYRVASVSPGFEKALGAHLVKIQDTPIERAAALLFSLTPQDEFPWYGQSLAVGYVANPRMLHGLGIIPTNSAVRYTLADDAGTQFDIELHSAMAGDFKKIQWIYPFHIPPISSQQPEETFYFVYLPESRIVYCNVRAIRNLSEPGKSLMSYLKHHEQEVDKLVIDLRKNGGGDYFVGLHHLVQPIRDDPHTNRPGHLFVLIGPQTFSAAMSNATHFRYQTKAILVGTAIGEKPNSFAEGNSVKLPNSHLQAGYSTKYYKFVEDGENIVRPDQEIKMTWEEYAVGKDAALEWILKYRQN